MSIRATIYAPRYHTNQGMLGHGQYYGQGAYCTPNTASQGFLILTTETHFTINAVKRHNFKGIDKTRVLLHE